MGASVFNVDADQNGTITIPVLVTESDGTVSDLTGYTGLMQVRTSPATDVLLASGVVTIDTSSGLVTAVVAANDTLTWISGVYDIYIVNGAVREYIARGRINLRPTVTRST